MLFFCQDTWNKYLEKIDKNKKNYGCPVQREITHIKKGPLGFGSSCAFVCIVQWISQRIFSFITLALKHIWKLLSENKKDSWKLKHTDVRFWQSKKKKGYFNFLIIHTFFSDNCGFISHNCSFLYITKWLYISNVPCFIFYFFIIFRSISDI